MSKTSGTNAEREHVTEAGVIADLAVKHVHHPQLMKVTAEGLEAEVMLVPNGSGGFEVTQSYDFIERRLQAPRRTKGTSNHTDLASLIAHIQRFKSAGSTVFANRDPSRPSLTCVYNYNRPDVPAFGDHRATYAFPVSDEWAAWQSKNGPKNAMNQASFAELIENRIGDVSIEAPGGAALDFIQRLGATYATPSRLLELSRSLEVRVNATVKAAVKLGSGESQVNFIEEHQNAEGGPLSVPGAFLLGIPVFKGGQLFQLPARLRYRVQEQKIVWFYELYRSDLIFDTAFADACEEVKEETALSLFLGSPE